MKIFISHASDDASIANALQTLLTNVSRKLEVLNPSSIGSGAPPPGAQWFGWLKKELMTCDVAIIVITPRSIISDWVIWEAGVVCGASSDVDRVLPVMIGVDALPDPLQYFQATAGDTSVGIAALLTKVVRGFPNVDDDYDDSIQKIRNATGFVKYFEVVKKIREESVALSDLAELKYELKNERLEAVKDNPVLNVAHSHYLKRVKSRVKEWGKQPLTIDPDEYPKVLVRIQNSLQVSVQAVAVVAEVEDFWNRHFGAQILSGSDINRTKRVFVFRDDGDLILYGETIWSHAQNYPVRVISRDRLVEKCPDYARNFSLIEHAGAETVLARYTKTGGEDGRAIEFTTEKMEVTAANRAFRRIWNTAEAMKDPGFDGFGRWAGTVFEYRPLEMSKYIEIGLYDRCELLHPHFIEMMERMIQIFEERKERDSCKVLEMGAGTGHFTTRLLNRIDEDGRLFAMELDHKCYRYLLDKISRSDLNRAEDDLIKVRNENSAIYDPPGRFDFIFSSFADHHICINPEVTYQYLENVKRNLSSESSFIIGDEFPPENDGTPSGINAALDDYHGYIIGEAKRQKGRASEEEQVQWDGLIQLETDALESGKQRVGDFKVPLRKYLERLTDAGLDYDEPIPIGPADAAKRAQVGGIYVIRAFLAKD